MDREEMLQLIDRWINDPVFRSELRRDPKGTIRRAGLELTPAEWETFKNMDSQTQDEELQSRAN